MEINKIVFELSNDILQVLPDNIMNTKNQDNIEIYVSAYSNDHLHEYLNEHNITVDEATFDEIYTKLCKELIYWINYDQ